MRLQNIFQTRGQPLPYDKRFNIYRIFSKDGIFDDVIYKNDDVSKNNDVMGKVKAGNCLSNGTL